MRTVTSPELRIIGTSAVSQQLDRDISRAAASDAKVLITGETGVGKDIVARLLHERSSRRAAHLATINCAGLPDSLLESELFGHVRGSFTGAYRDKAGLFEAADRGTAFLDEAGEMTMRMQGVLLRFLETGEIQRVGSERSTRRVNVRVIAATNRDLARHMADGSFREDLYYRLNVIRIHVPALRERREDIRVLFEHFLESYAREYDVAARPLTFEAADLLNQYRWPGNVRELKNVVERLVVAAPGESIRGRDLPVELRPESRAPIPIGSRQDASQGLDTTSQLMQRIDAGESFWSAVHAPFMNRDMSRDQLRAVVRSGLERTSGSYRLLVELFNMDNRDYKRFLGFLRKHHCHVPFHAFRTIRMRPAQPFVPRAVPMPAAEEVYAQAV